MRYALGCGALIVLVGVIVVLGGCGSYNRLVGLSQDVNSKWAQVQTDYQRRYDLIPNLVNTVAGAANFEKSTLTEITQARASVGQVQVNRNQAPNNSAELDQYQRAQDQLSGALSRLLVVVERYPQLQANSNFRDLQAQLEGTENRIAVARRDFNQSVQTYNTAVQRMPTAIVAGLFHFPPKPYFQSVSGAETPPKVQFDFGAPTNR